MTSGFDGRSALVTGAGSGIGNAVAMALAAAGATVILVGRRAAVIEAAASAIVADGNKARAFVADVCDAGAMEQAARAANDAAAAGLAILVTCAAGAASAGPSESLGTEAWRGVIDTDLTGTFYACQAAGKLMLSRKYGRIVNLASFHVVATYPQRAAYVAAKAGVVGLTQALAVEWGGRGVIVNAVAPGPIRTPRTSWFLEQDPANERGMVGRTPTGRLGELSDVVDPILFLASEQARHVNGQTIIVDGGWTKNAWWGRHPFWVESPE